jgi:hypothetical protein
MKTPLQIPIRERTRTLIGRILLGLLLATGLTPLTMPADADDSFQHNALFNPSQSQLGAEARGRVMIYEGLDNAVIERALDSQFERIEHMMFTRIPQAESDPDDDDGGGGEVTVEDDGC